MQEYPCDVSRIQDRTIVALIKAQTATGLHSFLVEVGDVFTRRNLKLAHVEVLPLQSGHRPEIFAHGGMDGWAYTSADDVLASQLDHVAVVEKGAVVEYWGKPRSGHGAN